MLDSQGRYTYVVSRPEDRPANATGAEGVTWLPFSTEPRYRDLPHVLVLRDMLPDRRFSEAVRGVPQDMVPADAASAMGAYYPSAATCSAAAFAAGGAEACLTSATDG